MEVRAPSTNARLSEPCHRVVRHFGGKRKIKLHERKVVQKCGYDHVHGELAVVNFYRKVNQGGMTMAYTDWQAKKEQFRTIDVRGIAGNFFRDSRNRR